MAAAAEPRDDRPAETPGAARATPGPLAPAGPPSTPDARGPRVTAAIVIHDDGSTIVAVLDALAALDDGARLLAEVLVVDNASHDDGPALAEAHPLRPRVIRRGVNDGPCGARNVGLAEALTPWVLALDGDVVPRPDCLTRLLAQAALPGVALVMPRAVLASDPTVVHYDGGSMHYAGIMCLPNLLAPMPTQVVELPRDVDAVISMALLVDRAALLDAGGWDETFFILFEDHDLSYRLRARGLRLRFDPGAIVEHHEGTLGISFRPGARAYPPRRAWLHGRNRSYLVLKSYSARAWWLTLPGRLLYDVAWLAFALRRGVALAWLGGRLVSLTLVPRAFRWRRRLAAARRLGDGVLLTCDPLSVSPVAAPRGLEARLAATLDGLLAGWWGIARALLPGTRASGTGSTTSAPGPQPPDDRP